MNLENGKPSHNTVRVTLVVTFFSRVMVIIYLLVLSFVLCSCSHSEDSEKLLHKFDSLYAKGEFQQAEQIGKQIGKDVPNHLTAEYVRFLGKMQLLTAQQGRYSESEQFCLAALSLLKELNKQDTPAYLSALTNLSRMYYYQGKDKEALELLWQLVHTREAQNPRDSILFHDYFYLGQSLAANGYDAQGISYLEKSYYMGNSTDNIEMRYEIILSLANGYHYRGQLNKAKMWGDSALQVAKRWKGQKSLEYAKALLVQGKYNYSQGNLLVAERQLLEALAITEGNSSADSYTINVAKMLGDYYSLQGSYSKADSFFSKMLQKMNDLQIRQHNPTGFADLHFQYISHLLRTRQYARAKNTIQEMLGLYESTLGNSSPKVLEMKQLLDSVQGIVN